jgi:hypothetical protein
MNWIDRMIARRLDRTAPPSGGTHTEAFRIGFLAGWHAAILTARKAVLNLPLDPVAAEEAGR